MICPICGVLYADCDCEPIIHVANGTLPNQRDAARYLKNNDAELIGNVYRLRDGHYEGQLAIKIADKLYIVSDYQVGIKRKKESE